LGGSERIMGIYIISFEKNSLDLRSTWVTTSPRKRIEFVSQWSTVGTCTCTVNSTHSAYTHSTLTVRQYCTIFPYIYFLQSVTVPCLDCEGYRGQCYWNRVKAVWLSGDWNVTVSTGSIRPWRWEGSCSVNRWEVLPVAAVAIADSCLMLLLNVAMCIVHQMYTDISYLFGQLDLQNSTWKWPCPYITWFNTLPVRW
jgi:hypothetical protein